MFAPGRVVDLGTGHGGYPTLAADLGWKVTVVDARTERWPDPLPPEVDWVQADMREVDLGQFDLILCLSIFYHLTAAAGRFPATVRRPADHLRYATGARHARAPALRPGRTRRLHRAAVPRARQAHLVVGQRPIVLAHAGVLPSDAERLRLPGGAHRRAVGEEQPRRLRGAALSRTWPAESDKTTRSADTLEACQRPQHSWVAPPRSRG